MSVEDRFQTNEEAREWLLSLDLTKIRSFKRECSELKKKFDELSVELLHKKNKLEQAKRACKLAELELDEVETAAKCTYQKHRLTYLEWSDELTALDADGVKSSFWNKVIGEDLRPDFWVIRKWCKSDDPILNPHQGQQDA